MRHRISIAYLLLAVLIIALVPGVLAQDGTAEPPAPQDVSFDLAGVAEDVTAEVVAAVPNDPTTPPGDEHPAYTRFTFADYAPDADADIAGLPAELHIYPVNAMSAYTLDDEDETGWATEAAALAALLNERPVSSEDEDEEALDLAALEALPFLPLQPAVQIMHARAAFLEFENGHGIRYLTALGSDVAPLTQDRVFYTFQGLTNDGQYYIVAIFPLATDLLPATIDPDLDYDAFVDEYATYLDELVTTLTDADAAAFTPGLDSLDALLTSLAIGALPAGEVTGRWELVALAGGPVIGDTPPTATFAAGQISGSGGCNNFSGVYERTGAGGLRIADLVSTERACLEDGVMDQESQYFFALSSVARFALEDGQLVLFDPAGEALLRFAPAAEME